MIDWLKQFVVSLRNGWKYTGYIVNGFWNRITDKSSKLHIIGDSHVNGFRNVRFNLPLRIFSVEGATVQGIVNPHSKTNAFAYFKKYIHYAINPKTDWVGLMLGEVDCGFVIWYRSQKYGIPVTEQLNITLTKYEEFLRYLQNCGISKIILFSAPLPTIGDNITESSVANLRLTIKATQSERTQLTLDFNRKLGHIAENFGCLFINLDNDLLDPQTGLIREIYYHTNPLDHHLNPSSFRQLIEKNLTVLSKKI